MGILAKHRNLIHTIREQYGYAPARLEQIKVEHRRILEAIAAGNPGDAEDAARIDLVNARDDILSRFRGFQPTEPAEAESVARRRIHASGRRRRASDFHGDLRAQARRSA